MEGSVKELSKVVKNASEKREKADYLDFFVASKEEADKQVLRAKQMIETTEKYLKDNGVL